MKKYILFDLDGTLTDSRPGIINSLQHALRFYGIERPPEDLIQFIGPPLAYTFREGFGFSPEREKEAVAKYREYFADKGIFENAVYPGVESMLRALCGAEKTLAVATSKPEEYSKRILEHFGIARYFRFIAGSRMDETRSDKAEVIAYALSSCGVPSAADAIMVGDRNTDIAGARKNGAESVGILYGYGGREELRSAGADHIIATVPELTDFLLSV